MDLYLSSLIDFEMVGVFSLIIERKDKHFKFQTEIDLDNETENIFTEICLKSKKGRMCGPYIPKLKLNKTKYYFTK